MPIFVIPSPAPGPAMSAKMSIDATVPLDEPRTKYDKIRVLGADEIDLSKYWKPRQNVS